MGEGSESNAETSRRGAESQRGHDRLPTREKRSRSPAASQRKDDRRSRPRGESPRHGEADPRSFGGTERRPPAGPRAGFYRSGGSDYNQWAGMPYPPYPPAYPPAYSQYGAHPGWDWSGPHGYYSAGYEYEDAYGTYPEASGPSYRDIGGSERSRDHRNKRERSPPDSRMKEREESPTPREERQKSRKDHHRDRTRSPGVSAPSNTTRTRPEGRSSSRTSTSTSENASRPDSDARTQARRAASRAANAKDDFASGLVYDDDEERSATESRTGTVRQDARSREGRNLPRRRGRTSSSPTAGNDHFAVKAKYDVDLQNHSASADSASRLSRREDASSRTHSSRDDVDRQDREEQTRERRRSPFNGRQRDSRQRDSSEIDVKANDSRDRGPARPARGGSNDIPPARAPLRRSRELRDDSRMQAAEHSSASDKASLREPSEGRQATMRLEMDDAQPARHAGRDEASTKGNARIGNGELTQDAIQGDASSEDSSAMATVRPLPTELYSKVAQVGEGTYGQVFKAKSEQTGIFVALKKIRMQAEKEGFPITAMREVKLLQMLRHKNIVRLHEMMTSRGSIYMVFEYMEHDLSGVLNHPSVNFSPAHIKSLASQLLEGLEYLHRKSVLHRDLKGSNILLNNAGLLKVTDFGLARLYAKRRNGDYTNRVVTLWYRPPELLLGVTKYGPEVDVWGAGCIFLELFSRKPAFQGQDEIDQLRVISDGVRTPSEENWPGVESLPWWELLALNDDQANDESSAGSASKLRANWADLLSPGALNLAEALLTLNPAQRLSAAQVLQEPYFRTESPEAQLPAGVLSGLDGEWHELDAKRARGRQRRNPE